MRLGQEFGQQKLTASTSAGKCFLEIGEASSHRILTPLTHKLNSVFGYEAEMHALLHPLEACHSRRSGNMTVSPILGNASMLEGSLGASSAHASLVFPLNLTKRLHCSKSCVVSPSHPSPGETSFHIFGTRCITSERLQTDSPVLLCSQDWTPEQARAQSPILKSY